MRYLVPGPLPCPEVVAVFYIRPAEVLTLFSVEGDAQVEQQNTVVGFLTIPDISNVLGQLWDSSKVTLVEPTPHDLGHFEGPSQDTLVEDDGTIAPRNEETTAGRGRGRGG